MKSIYIASILLLMSMPVMAQNKPIVSKDINQVIASVDSDNPSLKALREATNASKCEATTGTTLPNPEVEFNYLWGKPKDNEPYRVDLNISQKMEFPTVYSYRRKLASGQASEAEADYLVQRRQLLSQAVSLCVELAFTHSRGEILKQMAEANNTALNALQKQYESGDISVLDLSKARMEIISSQKEANLNAIDEQQLLEQLQLLCGTDKAFSFDSEGLATVTSLPADFDNWFASVESSSPEIILLQQRLDNSNVNVKMQKAQWLPQFSLGYVSERTSESTLQGIGLGIQIPLYERRNTVRAAKAQQAAATAQLDATRLQLKAQLKSVYNKAISLFTSAEEMEKSAAEADSRDAILKAFLSGEFDIYHFINETNAFYEILLMLNDTKKEATLLAEQLLIMQR